MSLFYNLILPAGFNYAPKYISMKTILTISLMMLLGLTAFDSINKQNKIMSTKSPITIFEIPASDFERAVTFYQTILDMEVMTMDMQGNKMGIFPGEEQSVTGIILQGEGYVPSADGVVIYFDGGNDLQMILDRIEVAGGQVIVPKTFIDEENGYFAMFMDTEGNRLGLHSPN